jgi:hypothetical protein
MEHWWNDTNRENPKYWEKKRFLFHFLHISHGLEHGPRLCFVCFYGLWQSPTWPHGVATPKTTILLARYHSDDETREDESVRACNTSVGEMHTGFWWGNLKERNQLEGLGVAGR